MFRIEFPKLLPHFQTPKTVSRPSRPSTLSSQTCCGTRRTIEFFKRRKMFGIELPKVLPLFQTPLTVSRLSRPWDCPAILTLEVEVQLRFWKEGKCWNWTSESSIEFFKRRKMFGIELPKVLPWFQTTLTVSRLSRPWDCPAILTLEVEVQLRFSKEEKCLELNFRKFCPCFRHLLPFPDCPDREIVQPY